MTSPTEVFIPHPRLHEVDRIAVSADPAETWDVVRHLDLFELRYVRALFTLRGAGGKSATLDEIVGGESGFHRLAEESGRYFVAGAIGKFWRPHIPFVEVAPATFRRFDEPGFGKVAWSVEVYPRGDGGSWIAVDLRVDATSDEAWNAFIPYWIAIGRFSRSIRRRWLRHFERKLGRALPDSARALPGDELLPAAGATQTDAVTIEASAEDVWTALERVPTEGLRVLDREANRALVFGSPTLIGARPTKGHLGLDYVATWAFLLEPIGEDATRLIVRVRADLAPTMLNQVAKPLLSAVHSIMEGAQLRHVRRDAEAHAHPPA